MRSKPGAQAVSILNALGARCAVVRACVPANARCAPSFAVQSRSCYSGLCVCVGQRTDVAAKPGFLWVSVSYPIGARDVQPGVGRIGV
eukprot:3498100-Lingulodinium_polyedra.AAC.1